MRHVRTMEVYWRLGQKNRGFTDWKLVAFSEALKGRKIDWVDVKRNDT